MKLKVFSLITMLAISSGANAANLALTVKPCSTNRQIICAGAVSNPSTGQSWPEMGLVSYDKGVTEQLNEIVNAAERSGAPQSVWISADAEVKHVRAFAGGEYYQLVIHSLSSNGGPRPRGF